MGETRGRSTPGKAGSVRALAAHPARGERLAQILAYHRCRLRRHLVGVAQAVQPLACFYRTLVEKE